MKIILGSSSKYRRAVLEGKAYQFEVMSPDIDEKAMGMPLGLLEKLIKEIQ